MGAADDYVTARSHWDEAAFRRALAIVKLGVLDEPSWVFWHRHCGLAPRPKIVSRFFTIGRPPECRIIAVQSSLQS
jgi:hypothetical protein